MTSQFYLRVNGIDIENLKVRRKMVYGAPIGEREFVIEDPLLGKFAIDDDNFIIEFRSNKHKKWQNFSVAKLLEIIDNIPSFQL